MNHHGVLTPCCYCSLIAMQYHIRLRTSSASEAADWKPTLSGIKSAKIVCGKDGHAACVTNDQLTSDL